MSSFKSSTSSSKKQTSFSPTVSFLIPDGVSNLHTPSSTNSKTGMKNGTGINKSSPHDVINSHVSSRIEITENITPNNLILLPMSQTMNESLTALVVSTSEQLEEIWNEVGFNPEDRASQLQVLLTDIQKLCEKKIAEENNVKETVLEEIADAKEEMRRSALALKIDVDDSLLQENTGMTLMEEIASLDAGLEGIRAAAEIATKDLCENRDKLITIHTALGKELDETWLDVSSDLTQTRRDEFHSKLKEMEEELSFRKSTVLQLLKDCQALIYTLKLDSNRSTFDEQIMGSLTNGADGKIDIKSIHEGESNLGVSAKNMQGLTTRVAELNGEKRRRKERIGEMGNEIHQLWEKLHIPKEEREAFAATIDGLGLDTIQKGEAELRRLNVLKKEMMGKLITDTREKIKELWKKSSTSESQKAHYDHIMKISDESDFTEDLLKKHEECVRKLEERLESMRPILNYIQKREIVICERMEYEQFQKDPERLQQRGAALTKQLMMEEKMSRRIKKDLPKFTSYLEKKLNDWHRLNNEPFLYNGEVYLDIMKQQEDEWQNYKDTQSKLKLKKKQNEAFEHSCPSGGTAKPLPGKKKILSHTSQRSSSTTRGSTFSSSSSRSGGSTMSSSRPLADGTNRSRAPSRGRAEDAKTRHQKFPTSRGDVPFKTTGRPNSNLRARSTIRK